MFSHLQRSFFLNRCSIILRCTASYTVKDLGILNSQWDVSIKFWFQGSRKYIEEGENEIERSRWGEGNEAMGPCKHSLMGKQLLLSVGLLPSSRWPSQNKPNIIFGGTLSNNVVWGHSFSFFNIIDPLHIYCGFQLSAFMKFLCTNVCISVSTWVSGSFYEGRDLFLLFAYFVLFWLDFIITFIIIS